MVSKFFAKCGIKRKTVILGLSAAAIVLCGQSIVLAADDADFVSQTVPQDLVTGQNISVAITMQNSGSTVWETNSNTFTTYFLGSQNPQGNSDWGLNKVFLPVQPIRPGENANFVFTIGAPELPGNYNFQWQMVREQSGVWNTFGQRTPDLQITVKPADEATITGLVIDSETKAPVCNAKVLIEVVGAFSYRGEERLVFEDYSPRAIWGQSKIVFTDSIGRYQETIRVPDFIPSEHRYARVWISRLYGLPLYQPASKFVPIPLSNTSYQANFLLKKISYGAAFIGTVSDAETGQRIPAANIVFGSENNIWTISKEGEFFGIVPLANSTQLVRAVWVIPDTTLSGEGFLNAIAINGIAYEPFFEEIAFYHGQLVRRDVKLKRKKVQSAITGRLTDSRTGKPIQNALVNLSQSAGFFDCADPRKCIYFTTYALTDIYGRYLLPITTPDQFNPSVKICCYFRFYTNGGFFPYNSHSAPYILREIIWDRSVEPGSIFEMNVSLDSK